jgi:hypothetical protein
VGGVEVAVGQVIAHPGDLPPGDGGLGGEQLAGNALTASPISSSRIRTASKIRLRQIAAPQMRADRLDRGLDI